MADNETSCFSFTTEDDVNECNESNFGEETSQRLYEDYGDEEENSRETPDEFEDTDSGQESVAEEIHQLKPKTELNSSENSRAVGNDTMVEPLPSSSKTSIKQEPSEENSVWIPTNSIKSEVPDAGLKASESEGDSDDEVGEEERLEEDSDSEIDSDSDGGAYHLAEVAYGEEDENGPQRPGSNETDSVLGISQDHFKPPRSYKKCASKHILVKTIILRKTVCIIGPDGISNQVKHFKCPTCSFSSFDKYKVVDHTYIHAGVVKPYTCPECSVTFRYSRCLSEHIRNIHLCTLNDCKLCGRKCGKRSALIKHLRVHTGEKPYACNFCDYRSTQQNHIKVHARKHTGEKPYKCSLCEYKCAYSVLLKKHILSHTNEKKYICVLCDYRAKTNESLQTHVKKHTGEKPFSCSSCAKRFHTRDDVKRHMKNIHLCKTLRSVVTK